MLEREGGFSTDTLDPGNYVGGKFVGTKYGISAASYPEIDIANLTVEQAKQIYYRDYWLKSGADKLPCDLALVHLDHAVNAGVGSAQQALKESGGDFQSYSEWRRQFYRSLKQYPTYGQAWINRVNAAERAAI